MADYLPALGELLQASQGTQYGGLNRGGAALGDLLGGGPAKRAELLYPEQLKSAATAAEALDKAAITRKQRLARDALSSAIEGDPSFAGHAPLGEAVLGMAEGQPNLNTYFSGMKDAGAIELQNKELGAIQSGDLKGAQAYAAVLKDKVLPELGADGKVVFTPLADNPAVMTPLGSAEIGAKNAQAGDYNAAALEHGAQGRAADALASTRSAGNALFDAKVARLQHLAGYDNATQAQKEAIAARFAMAKSRVAFNGADPEAELAAAQRDVAAMVNPHAAAAPTSSFGILGDIASSLLGGAPAAAAPAPLGSPAASAAPAAKTVVRTGTDKAGRKVVQYSDGSVDYAP